MSEDDPEYFNVRHRLWFLCLRWVVIVQAVLTILVGAFLLVRMVTTTNMLPAEFLCSGLMFVPATAYALFLAVRHWSFVRLWLTAAGLGQSGTFIRWQRVINVRRRYSLLSGWVLVVESDSGGTITLPERPTDPEAFREAVERFAGPDHPLTRAVTEVMDG